jgi:hypothetical protein
MCIVKVDVIKSGYIDQETFQVIRSQPAFADANYDVITTVL